MVLKEAVGKMHQFKQNEEVETKTCQVKQRILSRIKMKCIISPSLLKHILLVHTVVATLGHSNAIQSFL